MEDQHSQKNTGVNSYNKIIAQSLPLRLPLGLSYKTRCNYTLSFLSCNSHPILFPSNPRCHDIQVIDKPSEGHCICT